MQIKNASLFKEIAINGAAVILSIYCFTSKPSPKTSFQVVHLQNTGTFAAQTFLLNAVPQGDSYFERTGSKVTWSKLHLRFNAEASSVNTADKNQSLRVMIYWDQQPNQGAPSLETLLLYNNPASATPVDHFAYRDWQNTKRYRMIYDKFFTLAGGTGATETLHGVGRFLLNKDLHFKLKGKQTWYSGVNGNQADIAKNALWITFGSPGTNSNPLLAYFQQRLTFRDP